MSDQIRPVGRRPGRFAGLVAALVLALAGCSAEAPTGAPASDPTSSPSDPTSDTARDPASSSAAPSSPTAKPQRPKNAKIIEGQGYSFALPKGWVDLTRTMRTERPTLDVAVGAATQTDGFASNLVVDVTPIGEENTDTIDDVAEQILQSVQKRAPNYAIRPHASVGGLSAAHLSGKYTASKQPFWLEQFVVIGSSQTIVISFSLAPGSTAKERRRLIDTVLGSWMIES